MPFASCAAVGTTLLAVTHLATVAPKIVVLEAEVEGESATHVQDAITQGAIAGIQKAGHEAVRAPKPCTDAPCRKAAADETGATHILHTTVSVTGTDYAYTVELLDGASGTTIQSVEGTCDICTYQEAAAAVTETASTMEVTAAAPEPTTALPLVVSSDPEGATVHVDGVPAGTTPFEGEVEPGVHEVRVAKEGYDPVQQTVQVDESPASLEFDLMRRRYRPGTLGIVGWAVAATGVATLAGGLTLLVLDGRDVKSNCSGAQVDADGDCEFRYDTMTGGVVMTVLGVAAIGGGAGLVVWDYKREQRQVTAGIGPRGLIVQGRF